MLDQLSERLSDLAEFAAARNTTHDGDDDDTSDGEDLLAGIIVTPSESLNSTTSPDLPPEEPNEADEPSDEIPSPLEPPSHSLPQPTQQTNTTRQPEQPSTSTSTSTSTAPQPTTTTTTQTLRPRHPDPTPFSSSPPSNPPPQASTTSALFHNHQPTSNISAITTTEAILDHQRAEQDALSESILKLASDLKASSQAFSASLDSDRDVVDRAGQGITKTGQSMEGVTRSMGMLQRMTEGEGWWGRMKLYGLVWGLMVVLILVVFALPKLRF